MRRSDAYTALPEPVEVPDIQLYIDAYQQAPFFTRLTVWFQAVLGGSGVGGAMRMHEHRILAGTFRRSTEGMVDPSIPAVLEPFTRKVAAMLKKLGELEPALREATASRPGAFLFFVLQDRNPELAGKLASARTVPLSLLRRSDTTVNSAREAIHTGLQNALDDHLEELDTIFSALWKSLRALHRLARLRGLPPGPVPLRSIAGELVVLHQALDSSLRHRATGAVALAVAFAESRLASVPRDVSEPQQLLRETSAHLRLPDLIRLALEEPRAQIVPADPDGDWRSPFAAYLTKDIDPGEILLQYRKESLQIVITDVFHGTPGEASWLPAHLYNVTVEQMYSLLESPLFHHTRLMVGTLAREPGILSGADRKTLLELHSELDRQIEALKEMFGRRRDDPGTIGERIGKVMRSVRDRNAQDMEVLRIVEELRPSIQRAIRSTLETLEGIAQLCRGVRSQILAGLPRISGVLAASLGDESLRTVFEVIVEQYEPVVTLFRALLRTEDDEAERATSAASQEADSPSKPHDD